MTTYLAGLRVSELVNLKIKDVDAERMMIPLARPELLLEVDAIAVITN